MMEFIQSHYFAIFSFKPSFFRATVFPSMLAWLSLPTVLASSLLGVNAFLSAIQHQERALGIQCLDECNKNITAITDCQGNTTCVCNVDYTAIIQSEKCSFDCSEPEDWHPAPDNVTLPTSECGATTVPPNGTRASGFSLPECASGCLTTDNIPSCSDLSTTGCMCDLLLARSDESTQSVFRFDKCVVDNCEEHDAAVAFIQLQVDCGQYPVSTSPSDLRWPNNKFKAVYDASASGAAFQWRAPGCLILALACGCLGFSML